MDGPIADGSMDRNDSVSPQRSGMRPSKKTCRKADCKGIHAGDRCFQAELESWYAYLGTYGGA
jgi:hypothetical protein